MRFQHVGAIFGIVFLLSACSVKESDDEQAAASGSDGDAGVIRQADGPSPTPASSPTRQQQFAPIQTQPGPKGTTVDLVQARVTGDVLTVGLTYRKEGFDCCIYVNIDEASVIDDATSQRLGVLKDNQEKWMAAPIYESDADRLRFPIDGGVAQVWFKFPAPSAGTPTVSINIPGVLPFDAVPLTR